MFSFVLAEYVYCFVGFCECYSIIGAWIFFPVSELLTTDRVCYGTEISPGGGGGGGINLYLCRYWFVLYCSTKDHVRRDSVFIFELCNFCRLFMNRKLFSGIQVVPISVYKCS
jgi:hypothetical protein